ncbi:MAG: zf-HC2 domain-containing protein [Acidobacteria bacterium]|nr:MAG: zf-HC2 domain-containing protein [Acidobacteriota bacterium]
MAEDKQKQTGIFGCEDFDVNLAAYLEGESNQEVRQHARQCSSCGSLLDDLESIRVAAKDLPLESPSSRVWSNIRVALANEGLIRERESLWRRWISSISLVPRTAPAAALAFALMLAVILVFKGDIQNNGDRNPALTQVTISSTGSADLLGVQSNLARTVQTMEENYKTHEALLDPSVKKVYRAGLASLDNSIQECLDSLQKQPHNALVRDYLMQAYAQKAEVLASALEYGGR